MAHERKCIVCGKIYEYCPHCNQTPEYWKMIYCSENCREIQNVFSGYKAGKYTKEEANNKFNTLDISNKESFRDEIKDIIATTPVVEPIIVDEVVEEKHVFGKKNKNRYNKPVVTNDIVNEIIPEETKVIEVELPVTEE